MKCTRLVCLTALAVLLIAVGQVMATPVSEDFSGFSNSAYGVYTYNGFRMDSALCNTVGATVCVNPLASNAVRLRDCTSGYVSNLEYIGSDGEGKDGGVGVISFDYKPWDSSPTAVYTVSVNVNGAGYTVIGNINISDCMNWATFTHALNNSSDNIKIKVARVSGERLHIDNFSISDYAGGDVTPPSISSVSLLDATHLDVLFSEPVDLTTSETEANYVVTPGSVNPSLATRDGGNIALVHLTFASPLPLGADTLTVNGVQDTSSNHNACSGATAYFQRVEAGSVIITEVMYDDTALADSEWVELHNMTGSAISIAGWYLTDDDSYPALSGEGAITIPAGTTIPANGYVVVAKSTLPFITGEVVCTQSGSFALGNSGDNLALYSAATGGTLVDGSLSINYPDMSTPGFSIERCAAAWDSSASAWQMSTNVFGTDRYLYCTPGAVNSACVDTRPPEISHLLLIGDTQLDVWWDEPVDLTTAETEANYVVTPGGATPSSALRDGGNIFLVHLTFASAFPPGTDTLTVNAVEDTSSNNNACVNEWWTFASGGDLTPPSIVSVTPLSKTALDVVFTEPVDLTTAETEANYTVYPGNANPNSALRDATNLALVHLTFASNLPAGVDTLNVNAVEDTSSNSNACVNAQKTFFIPLANEGDVVINEIMYDDTASTDAEWVELYNRTASAIDISGWVVLDAAMYPVSGSEGGFYLPPSTSIPANGYLVVSKVALDGIAGEVVGTQYSGSWALGNTGDNVGLYTDTVGGLRIDGWATSTTLLFYPDWTTSPGSSLEKCVENSPWPADSTGWHVSTNAYATTGRYRFCTPGVTNSPCVADTIRPTLVSATVMTYTTLDVVFSEPVDQTTGETVTNYSVNNGVGNPATATRQTLQTTVRLVFASPMPANSYILTVNNVQDQSGNPILPGSTIGFTVVTPSYSIVITEVMPDPAAVADGSGEWFEIHNGGASAVDMTGWQVTDGEGTFTISSATINAGQYFVFCVAADSVTNGGVPENYVYPYAAGTGLQLNNTADDITVRDNLGTVLASVAYTTSFPWGTGNSMQLRNLSYNPAFDTSWCAADTVWPGSRGDRGTPGVASICPGPFIPDTITICSIRVQTDCGIPVRLNDRVVTRGVISFADTCRASAYLQSGGCGITIYGTAVFNIMGNSTRRPAAGDSVMVEGHITQFRGLTEFSTYATFVPVITFISSGHTVTPVEIACTDIGLLADSCRGENFESEMVRLSNVTFINPVGNFPALDSNYAVLCGTDTVYFRMDSCDAALVGTAIPTVQIHITGVLGQFDSTLCYCRGYQLLYAGGTTFAPAQCAEPESLTVIRDGMTDNIVLRWRPGAGQTCNCYEIYWAADATTVWPTGYTYLAHVVGSTTYTDVLGTQTRRFYRVTAGGPHCP